MKLDHIIRLIFAIIQLVKYEMSSKSKSLALRAASINSVSFRIHPNFVGSGPFI